VLLVTGFEPFGGLERNPSADVARALAANDVVTEVLPVEYRKIEKSIAALLTQPFDAVVLLGVAVSRSVICPERVAINFRDPTRPDNDGQVPATPEVIEDGPDAYFSNLPMDEMVTASRAAGVAAAVSLSAGSYLCNASFYIARHLLAETPTKVGFLHLPPTPDLACAGPPMPLDDQVTGVGAMLNCLRV
jgi:pyroglutamyl-peptidase